MRLPPDRPWGASGFGWVTARRMAKEYRHERTVMRNFGIFCAAACIFGTLASPASASSFSGSTFVAIGSMSISPPPGPATIGCTANIAGSVNADGTATITSARFTGGAGLCDESRLAMPITLTANSATSVTVTSLKIDGPISCGPQVIAATWVNGTPSQFHIFPVVVNPGGCTVSIHTSVTGTTILP